MSFQFYQKAPSLDVDRLLELLRVAHLIFPRTFLIHSCNYEMKMSFAKHFFVLNDDVILENQSIFFFVKNYIGNQPHKPTF